MARLKELYQKTILPELKTELGLSNDLAVPRIEKVVVNAGLGRVLTQEPKRLDLIIDHFAKIVGQKPVATRARQAISAFKIRAGQIVGLSCTLRGRRMYEFLDKLVNVALPRSRDFRGLSKTGFDGHGNYTCGIREHIIFPEMVQEEALGAFGFEITVVTTASTNEQAYRLLKKLGFPFRE